MKIAKKTKERINNFLKALDKEKIDLMLLQSLTFKGVPDECTGLRSLV